MYLGTPQDFLFFAINRGTRRVQPMAANDLLAVRATCRDGRDMVDESQYWQDLHDKHFSHGQLGAKGTGIEAKAVFLEQTRQAVGQEFSRVAVQEALVRVGKAMEHSLLATLSACQLPMLPLALTTAPAHCGILGAATGAAGSIVAATLTNYWLRASPVARTLGVAGCLVAAPTLAGLGAAIGFIGGVPMVAATYIALPLIFGAAVPVDFLRIFGMYTGLLLQPKMRLLLRQYLESPADLGGDKVR